MANQTDFYLTLPSNTVAEGNTTSEFIVPMAYNMELTGEWQVGLAEIQYPVSFNTVKGAGFSITTADYNDEKGTHKKLYYVPLGASHFITPQALVNALNHDVQQFWADKAKQFIKDGPKMTKLTQKQINDAIRAMEQAKTTSIRFQFNDDLKRITIDVDTKMIFSVELDPKLKYMLGMKKGEISWNGTTKGDYYPDINGGVDSMYIYCSIITPQYVGDVRAPLLKGVPLRGAWGENVDIDYPNVHYVDVLTNSFDRVVISIKGSDGQPISFDYGKLLIKLHFRKKRLI